MLSTVLVLLLLWSGVIQSMTEQGCQSCMFTQEDYVTPCQVPPQLFCSAARADCHAQQAQCILEACLTGPVVLGVYDEESQGLYSLVFTTLTAIKNFLPATGEPGVLTGSLVDPTTAASAGVFAGELLVAVLNAKLYPVYSLRFSSLCPAVPPVFIDMTVNRVIQVANQFIAGRTGGRDFNASALTRVLSIYNQARRNTSYARCFLCNESIVDAVAGNETPTTDEPTAPSGGSTGAMIGIVVFVVIMVLAIIATAMTFYILARRSGISPLDRLNRITRSR